MYIKADIYNDVEQAFAMLDKNAKERFIADHINIVPLDDLLDEVNNRGFTIKHAHIS